MSSDYGREGMPQSEWVRRMLGAFKPESDRLDAIHMRVPILYDKNRDIYLLLAAFNPIKEEEFMELDGQKLIYGCVIEPDEDRIIYRFRRP